MLEKYDAALEAWIADIVANGDDDAVFASGYLQGHFAVVLSELEQEATHELSALEQKMQHCLTLAQEELADADYQLVEHAWEELHKRLAA